MNKDLVNPFIGYKPPFEFDGHNYIFTDEGSMALCSQNWDDVGDILERVEGLLNKKREDYFEAIGTTESDPCALKIDNVWFIIRGWGHLTGTGAMNLPQKEACEIQDAFRDWLIARLKGKESPYDVYYQEAKDRVVPIPEPEPEPEISEDAKYTEIILEEGEELPDLWSTAQIRIKRVPKGWRKKQERKRRLEMLAVQQPFYTRFLRLRRKKR